MIKKTCLTVLLITIFFCSSIFAGTIQLPQTGQTTCYDSSGNVISCAGTGQDGDIRAGVAWPNPRFTDNGDGTVTDNLTGLIWTKDANAPGPASCTPGVTKTWQDSLDYISCLNANSYLGYTDWRLPNVIELDSLIDLGSSNPPLLLDNPFINVQVCDVRHWSSTTGDPKYAPNTAYDVEFGSFGSSGHINAGSWKSNSEMVWPVRSGINGKNKLPKTGQTKCYNSSGSEIVCAGTGQDGEIRAGIEWPSPRFTDNGNGTVTDNLTALMWTKDANPPGGTNLKPPDVRLTWQEALDYIKVMNSGEHPNYGYTDWRLPNRKELLSLLDYQNSWPSFPPGHPFFDIGGRHYTSTTYEGDSKFAWTVSTQVSDTMAHFYDKSYKEYVWPVRSDGYLIISKSGLGTGVITSSLSGINCGSQCLASFTPGLFVTLTAQANSDSTFAGWAGGECQGASTCTVAVTNKTIQITALFALKNSNSLKFTVYDSKTGDPLKTASVNLDGQILTTDDGGATMFSGLVLGDHNLAISKTGYQTYQNKINLTETGLTKMGLALTPATVGTNPTVTDVVSYVSDKTKAVYFLDGVNYQLNFSAIVNWNGKIPGKVRFITPQMTFEETSGNHTFNMGTDFGPGGRLQVTAVSTDGISSNPFDANFEVMPKPLGAYTVLLDDKGSSFSYSFELDTDKENLTVIVPHKGATVSVDIPIFGGKEMSLGIKAQASVNVGSDGTATYSFAKFHDNENPLKVAGYAFDTGWSIGGDVSLKYRENVNQWRFDSGYFNAGLWASKNIPPYYVWVPPIPIPFYLRGTINASLDASLGFTGWSEGAGWQLGGAVEPGIGGKAIAGAGVADALSVEGYLGIDGSLLFGFPATPIFREATLALSGGVSAKALWFTYIKPLWEYTWSWPEHSTQSLSRFILGEDVLKDIRTLEWQPIPRNYGSGLSGGRQALEADRASLDAIPDEQIIPGQTDIYPYSYPSLISMGNDLLLAWVTDDLTKTANNRTSIVYSWYAGGQWSAPTKVGEDGTADYYPALAAMTGGAVATWQDTGVVLGDQATMEEIMAQQEIGVSLFNAGVNTWSVPVRLTANSYLDRSPLIATSGEKAIIVWIANEQNDMFGSPAKPNMIKYAAFNGTAWSSAQTVATGVGAILKSALSYRGSTVTYVFTVDVDGDLSTLTDQDLYITTYDGASWSPISRLTEDTIQDTNPQLAYDANGDQLLVWYRDGKFQMAKNMDMANSAMVFTPGLSSGAADFRLVSGNNGQLFIVWPDASPKGQDIYMAPYDPTLNVWGKGMMMTNTDSMERTLSAVQMPNGKVAVVYNKVETIFTPKGVQVGGKTVTMNVPGPGKTDLCMSAFALEGDLAVKENGLTVSSTSITPGAALTFNAAIVNKGLKPTQNIGVDFYYGDPSDGGVLIGQRQTISGPLAAGDVSSVSLTWQSPQTPAAKDIYVVVDPDLGIEDRDRYNNSTHLAIFKPDLIISQMFAQTVGPVKRSITVNVTNRGTVSASGIPVTIYRDSLVGPLLYQETIDSLAVNETRSVVYEWNTSAIPLASDGQLNAYAFINKEQTIPETSYLNNSRAIQLLGAFPGSVTKPTISDGATGISIRPIIAWEAVPGASGYDFYLWKDGETKPTTPTMIGLNTSSGKIQTALLPSSLYHWQVIAKNSSGQSEGPEWSFTTGNYIIGDVNDDQEITLADAILVLQVAAGYYPPLFRADYVSSGVDVNGDAKIGIVEAIYVLQCVARLRTDSYVNGMQ